MQSHKWIVAMVMLGGCASGELGGQAAAIGGGGPSASESVVFVQVGATSCSGTVIGPRHVLTAKLCLYETGTAVSVEAMQVYVGSDVRTADRMLRVSRVIALPGPPGAAAPDENDLAVLITRDLLSLPPLALAATDPAVDEELTIIGYGADETGGGIGMRREGVARATGVTGTILTAEGSAGVCSGDGGGPAIDPRGDVAGISIFAFRAGGGAEPPGCPDGSGFRAVAAFRSFLDAALLEMPTDAGVAADDAATSASDGSATVPDASATPTPSESSGCACTAGLSRSGTSGALTSLLLLLLALAWSRRRRRRL